MILRAALCLVLLLPGTALARVDQVLLIGVTDYAPEVTEIAQPLAGPGNDVALMLDVFQTAGVDPKILQQLSPHLPGPADNFEVGLPLEQGRQRPLHAITRPVSPGFAVTLGHRAQFRPVATLEGETATETGQRIDDQTDSQKLAHAAASPDLS